MAALGAVDGRPRDRHRPAARANPTRSTRT
jgi:hypothetical protein